MTAGSIAQFSCAGTPEKRTCPGHSASSAPARMRARAAEDRPPEEKRRERQESRRDRRGEPRDARDAVRKGAEEAREDQRQPRRELHPVPARNGEPLVAQAHAEENQTPEVGEGLGRIERDDEEA